MRKVLSAFCFVLFLLLCACRVTTEDELSREGAQRKTESISEDQEQYALTYDIIELFFGESFDTDELSFDSLTIENTAIASLSSDRKKIMSNRAGETVLTARKDGETATCLIRVKDCPELPEKEPEKETEPGKYRLLVNKKKNYVLAYAWEDEELKEPFKAMICSCGENTPSGCYTLGSRKVWNRLYGGVWGKYATVITGDFLFHSVPYFQKDSSALEAEEYNKLGTTASAGCVRLTVTDAKWIYDTCLAGSLVIFTEEAQECPLPIPGTVHLNAERCWDPTDPDPENPWSEYDPTIETESILLDSYSIRTLKGRLKGTDTVGNDISDRIVCDESPDLNKAGYYRLYLTLTDDLNRSTQKKITLRIFR